MRARYWSNSKVADSLRKVFSLPKNLLMGTREEWDGFHELEQKTSPFGMKVIDSLDTIQKVVYFIPDMYTSIVYYAGNVLDSTHVLKTNAKRGSWSDLVSKIPEALLLSIVDFVEVECFHMYVTWNSESATSFPPDVQAYRNQSYLRRKLFSKKVTEAHAGEYGLKYIAYQMADTSEEAKTVYQSIIDAYKFAKGRFKTFDPYEESGYNLLPAVGFMKTTDEHIKCFETVRKLEEAHTAEVIRHCVNIVKYHEYLWA